MDEHDIVAEPSSRVTGMPSPDESDHAPFLPCAAVESAIERRGPAPGHRSPRRTGDSKLAANAREFGLAVHPFTLRADRMPDFFADFEALQRFVFVEQQADGAFTDFPDLTLEFLQRQGLR